jgi:CDP-glycerol glycerophosphotransferase (TagB/SpsB family)
MHVPYNGTLKIKGDRIGTRVDQKKATNLLTKMLQDRTGAKVINFFLADWSPMKFERHSYQYFRDHDRVLDGLKTWKSDNYAIATSDSMGWDEQYLVRTVKVDNTDAMDNVQDSDTTAKKKNAFLKSMKGRSTSRVVLNRFIDLIA